METWSEGKREAWFYQELFVTLELEIRKKKYTQFWFLACFLPFLWLTPRTWERQNWKLLRYFHKKASGMLPDFQLILNAISKQINHDFTISQREAQLPPLYLSLYLSPMLHVRWQRKKNKYCYLSFRNVNAVSNTKVLCV